MTKPLKLVLLFLFLLVAPSLKLAIAQEVGEQVVIIENYDTKIVDKITGRVNSGEIHRLIGVETLNQTRWFHVEGVRGWFPGRIALSLKSAEQHFSQLLSRNPQDASSLVARGSIRFELNRPDEALVDFDKALKLSPNSPLILNNMGRAMRARGSLGESLGLFSEAIRIDPKYTFAYHNRGLVYYELQEYQQAIQDFKKAIELNPNDPWFHINCGHAQHANQDVPSALKSYQAAEKLNPKIPEIFIGRSHVFLELDDLPQALAASSKAVELAPADAVAQNSRGWIHFKNGSLDLAKADFDRAVELDREFPLPYSNRGITHTELRNFDAALQDFQRALELQPDSALVYFNRGNAYFHSEQWDLAKADYEKAGELAQEMPEAIGGLAWFFATCPEDSHRDSERALLYSKKLEEIQPDDAKTFHILAAAYANAGNFQEAELKLGKAIELTKPSEVKALTRYKSDLKKVSNQQPIRFGQD